MTTEVDHAHPVTRGSDWPKKQRLRRLEALSEEIYLAGFKSGAYDMLQGTVQMYAARTVALAEALLTELEKVERGEEITEETNVAQGTLFAGFRGK